MVCKKNFEESRVNFDVTPRITSGQTHHMHVNKTSNLHQMFGDYLMFGVAIETQPQCKHFVSQ